MSLNKLGRYDLIRVLGKGAMGLVYEGRDPNLDRRVAIKTIRVENLSDEDAAEYEVRFRTEARSAARLQHPNIVSVYDSDRDLDIAYLVMEFIQGQDLKYHLDKGDVYTLEQTLGIMRDLLSALDYAHQQSIVHRDIKPANLLIEASGRVKLTDFGVARIQNSGEATRTQGTMVGTLKYMSPEQIQGHPVDARADLFAAGIVLHQLLTGQRPFDGESDFAVIQQIVSHDPVAPSAVNSKLPPALDAVLARALAKSRHQRYATANEFSDALQEASKQATDPTVTPASHLRDKRSSSTWTATLRAGESLLSTQPGNSLTTHTGMNSSVSTVTQELELVYWKDIRDSVDAEDIKVFLAKFPEGIYADLAHRRLKKLASPLGEGSDIGLVAHAPLMSAASGEVDPDKTVMVPRQTAHTTVTVDIGTAYATPVAESVMLENLKTTPQTIEETVEIAAVAPGSTAAEQAFSTTGDAASFAAVADVSAVATVTAVAQDKASQSAQPTKTPTAPPISTAATAKQSASPAPSRLASQANLQMPPGTVTATNPQRRLVWSAAGVIALVCAGLGVKFLSGGPAADSSLAIAAAASAPASAAASAPVLTPSAPLSPLALPSTASPASAVGINSTLATASAASAPAAPTPATAASKAALAQATARKAAIEKDRLAKLAPEKNVIQSVPADSVLATTAMPAAESRAAAAPAQTSIASNPRQACEDRILIGFQICMRDQCAKPAFVNHPVCVERKAMEQQRRDAQIGK